MEFYETLVTIELRTVPEGTELTLTHGFFPTAEERDKHRSGWTGCLTQLIEALVRKCETCHRPAGHQLLFSDCRRLMGAVSRGWQPQESPGMSRVITIE